LEGNGTPVAAEQRAECTLFIEIVMSRYIAMLAAQNLRGVLGDLFITKVVMPITDM